MSSAFVLTKNRTKYNAKKNENILVTLYVCLYCKKEYDTYEKAEICVDNHNLVLLPIALSDLNRLNKFIYLKNDELITPELLSIISRYRTKGSLKP